MQNLLVNEWWIANSKFFCGNPYARLGNALNDMGFEF